MKKKLRDLLRDTEWYDGRCIDIEYEMSILEKEGYTIPNEKIKKLLCEFWNIDIKFNYENGLQSNIYLNIENALAQIDYDFIHKYELGLNKLLWPVGTINYGSGLIILSNDCCFYLVANNMFFEIDRNFYDFIETVIEMKDICQISWQ